MTTDNGIGHLRGSNGNGNDGTDQRFVDASKERSDLYERWRQRLVLEHPDADHAWVCMLARKYVRSGKHPKGE